MKLFVALCVLLAVAYAMADSRNDVVHIPGLNAGFGAGFDVKAELHRFPIFQFTFDEGQTWKCPSSGQVYAIPDQVFLTELEQGQVDTTMDIVSEWKEFSTSLTESYGIDVGLGYGEKADLAKLAFTHSQAEVKGYLSNSTSQFGMEHRYLPLYQLDMWPDTPISSHFTYGLSKLPATAATAEDAAAYQAFIEMWGTHIFSTAQFGGYVNITTVFATSLYNTFDDKWVKNQVSLSVQWEEINVGINAARNKSTHQVDNNFKQHSYSEHFWEGGDNQVFASSGYDSWIKTISATPGLLKEKARLIPLCDFVADPTRKATLRAQLIHYIKS